MQFFYQNQVSQNSTGKTSNCDCPDDCVENIYTSSLSMADISSFKLEQMMLSSNKTRERCQFAMETLHRVDETKFQEILSSLEDIIDSHEPLRYLINRGIVNKVTSIVNTILKSLRKTARLIADDAKSLQRSVLDNLNNCYYSEENYMMKNLDYLVSTALQELSSVQLIFRRYKKFEMNDNQTLNDFQHRLNILKQTLKICYDYMNAITNKYCPSGLLSSTCLSHFNMALNEIEQFNATLETIMSSTFSDDIPVLVHQTNDGLEQSLTNLSSCVMNYSQILSLFQSYLSEFNIDTSAMSAGNYNSLLTLFNNDLVWLKNQKDSYMSGGATKQDLAQLFSNTSSNQLLINIENVMTTIDQSVIFDINSFTTTMTTQAVAGYLSMLKYLSRLQEILGAQSIFIDEAAQSLLIWRVPQFAPNNASVSL